MQTADEQLEEAYFSLFEHYTPERQIETLRSLRRIYTRQQGGH